jgi:hypothetical protein
MLRINQSKLSSSSETRAPLSASNFRTAKKQTVETGISIAKAKEVKSRYMPSVTFKEITFDRFGLDCLISILELLQSNHEVTIGVKKAVVKRLGVKLG